VKLDEFTLTIVFLFFPGLVCAIVTMKLTTHGNVRSVDYVIPTLVYGFLIYVAYSWIASVLPSYVALPHVNLLLPESRQQVAQSPVVLTVATIIGIVIAFVSAAALNGKILHKIARILGVTRKFGDKDVWNYVMNSEKTDWLVVRDKELGIYYVGRITVYSDDEEVRELMLAETKAYDNLNGEELYDAGTMYFSFPSTGIILEIPPKRDSHG